MDPSGVRLRAWMGLNEDEFYEGGRLAIVPMAFCFPGYDGKGKTGNGGALPPPKVCAEKWRQRVILLAGGYAQRWHLGGKMRKTLTETVAHWPQRFSEASDGSPLYLPLPHPSWRNTAWLKKNAWFEADVVPRLQATIRAVW